MFTQLLSGRKTVMVDRERDEEPIAQDRLHRPLIRLRTQAELRETSAREREHR